MSETTAATPATQAPNLMFSHMGFACSDVAKMEDFYTRVLGFTVTDRGEVMGMDLVFLSRDPLDHHQLVLVSGRPDNLPPNPFHPQFGSVINQISFRVCSLAELRALHERFQRENVQSIFIGNHGIAWSIYCHDPDGNNLEFFVDTPWYFPQPFLIPLDLSQSDEAIIAETRKMAQEQPGYEPYADWRKTIAKRMTRYQPAQPVPL
ncbi:MAG: VOC family protein [Proteobacteria bacterium]|nr:VOC family protein [Pseudomonadota bacterium]